MGSVPSSVYLGPYAQVLGGAVSGSARIKDHAVVLSGTTVSGGTVTGLSVLTNGFRVSGSARAASSFYPLGFFEGGQSISGTTQLVGDVEYRGQRATKASGTYFGYVDSASPAAGNTADVTLSGPYSWRPNLLASRHDTAVVDEPRAPSSGRARQAFLTADAVRALAPAAARLLL